MKRSVPLILVGVILLALSGAWFFTPLGEGVLSALRPEKVAATRSLDAPATLDILNTTLNALNALFGAVGIYLAAKGYRLQKP